jgi:hypothetical protein
MFIEPNKALHIGIISILLLTVGFILDKMPDLHAIALAFTYAGVSVFASFCSFRLAMFCSRQYIAVTWPRFITAAVACFVMVAVLEAMHPDAKAERARLEAAQKEAAKPEPVKPEPAKPAPAKPEQVLPKKPAEPGASAPETQEPVKQDSGSPDTDKREKPKPADPKPVPRGKRTEI